IVVIEKLSELPELLRLSEEMNVQPLIGLRSKLSTKGTGKWESSSGDFAKFGLTTPELIQAVKMLKERGLEGAAKLFHFHGCSENGAEITDGRTVPVPEMPETPIVREMREIVAGLTPKNSGETYNDAVAKKEQALTMFKPGILGLEERAIIEGLFWRLCRKLV